MALYFDPKWATIIVKETVTILQNRVAPNAGLPRPRAGTRFRLSGTWRRVAVLGALLLIFDAAALAQAQGDARQTIEKVYAGSGYQTELPRAIASPDRPPRQQPRSVTPPASQPPAETTDTPFQGLGDLPRALLWLFVIVGGVLLAAFLLREIPNLLNRRQRPVAGAPAAGLETARPHRATEASLADAERLAAGGRFAEAVRVLLLHAFDGVRERVETVSFPSLTNREVLRRASLREASRAALTVLLRTEEKSEFGGQPVDRAAYRECREKFDRFRQTQMGET